MLADGACNVPTVPDFAREVPATIGQVTPDRYRNPDQLDDGGVLVVGDPPLTIDLSSGEIRTIVWATGFRSDHSWLDVPVLDHKGRVRHDGGVVIGAPGMYLLGATFLRRRKSSFIHGAGDDAEDLAEHLAGYLSDGLTPT